jgi:hypothetical protein
MFQTLTRSVLATMIATFATLVIVTGSASPAQAGTRASVAKAAKPAAKPVPVQHASRAAFILTLR